MTGSWHAGKGDRYRPVNRKRYEVNYCRIFGEKEMEDKFQKERTQAQAILDEICKKLDGGEHFRWVPDQNDSHISHCYISIGGCASVNLQHECTLSLLPIICTHLISTYQGMVDLLQRNIETLEGLKLGHREKRLARRRASQRFHRSILHRTGATYHMPDQIRQILQKKGLTNQEIDEAIKEGERDFHKGHKNEP